MTYDFTRIEKKWQRYWIENKTFKAEIDPDKPKQFILDMFPYPSGSGLHVGHPEGYTATDILSRYRRMCGVNVLHCMGWDAFGLPAEQAALKTGRHPKLTTAENIAVFKRQIIELGFSYDWDREINTTDTDYVKWTQWIFLQLNKKGLAYLDDAYVNWCPELKAVLANEEVIDGKSERGGYPVYRKKLRQWLLKITAYADRLLDDLEELDWPESIKEMQRNWIGKSAGASAVFQLEDGNRFDIFTTRPDTMYGATFCVLAPEHALVETITTPAQKAAVTEYLAVCATKSELERTADKNEKTGVFTGSYAVNPVNGEKVPVWISDYVLVSYGTGAIMCVPAHDQRDHDFAVKFGLPIIPVVAKDGHDFAAAAMPAEGTIINSPLINGLSVEAAKQKIIAYLEARGTGSAKITYRLRDWLFSRQRYWGEPIPMLLDESGNPHPLDETELPLRLPDVGDFRPSDDGLSPLARAQEWLQVQKDGRTYTRETNTMPQWAGSCWYYLRFTDPDNSNAGWSAEAEKYWMPVDLYVGGAEHAVLHLLYARFWHKVLYDLGYVSTKEPFYKLVNQGIILGSDGNKMAKSAGNVVNPDDLIASHGADSLRLYEMFMGPLEKVKPWQTNGIDGCFRFLNRVWRLLFDEEGGLLTGLTDNPPNEADLRQINALIASVTEDIEKMKFNTAIASMMSFVNYYNQRPERNRTVLRDFTLLLSPFAPHIAEEMWAALGGQTTLAYETWPVFDPAYISRSEVTLPIQVNGKVRDQITVPDSLSESEVMAMVRKREKIIRFLDGNEPKKQILVPGKIVSLVV